MNHPEEEPLVLLAREEGIATLTLNRPATRNALGLDMRAQLCTAIEAVRDDDSVRAVVLTGAGDSFCAGGDISQMFDQTGGSRAWRARMRRIHRWFPELVNLDKPVIAAVDGPAFGAGLSLTLACDFVVATPRAKFCAVFARLGFVPDMGAMYLLPRVVGLKRAKELAFSARSFDADEAAHLGIVDHIVAPELLQETAQMLARRFIHAPTEAIGMAKSIMNQAFNLDAHAMSEFEAYAQTIARASDYHQACLERFAAKQPPIFRWEDVA